MSPTIWKQHVRKLEAKYICAQELETALRTTMTEDAEILLVGYGIVSRVLRSAVDSCAPQGMKAGLFRPITLWPFPSRDARRGCLRACKKVLVVELSTGQMVEDVRLALNGRVPVEFYGRAGGNVPIGGRDYRAGVSRAWQQHDVTAGAR